MGYRERYGLWVESSGNRLGILKNVWVSGDYGLWEVWVKRDSTVSPGHICQIGSDVSSLGLKNGFLGLWAVFKLSAFGRFFDFPNMVYGHIRPK